MVKVKWLGHAAFKITTDESKVIYLDPWLERNPVSPVKVKDVDKADIVCVSHGHNDHIGDAIQIVKKTGAKLICSPEIGHYADSKGIKYDEDSCPLNVGGSAKIGNVTVHMTPASHTTELYGEEWINERRCLPGAGSVGYVIQTEKNVRIYFAGDTGLSVEMKMIGEVYNPHIALLPVGGKYNMGPKLASIAARWIRPEVFVPMHYNTYPAIRQDMKVLESYLKESVVGVKLFVLNPGDEFEYGEKQ